MAFVKNPPIERVMAVSALSAITGKARRTIDKRLEMSNLVPMEIYKGRKGRFYETQAALKVIYKDDFVSKDNPGLLDVQQESARLNKARADAQELKNQVIRNETVPVEVIERVLASIGQEVVSILEGIPGKVSQRLPVLTKSEVNLIHAEIVKCRNIIADGLEGTVDRAIADAVDSVTWG